MLEIKFTVITHNNLEESVDSRIRIKASDAPDDSTRFEDCKQALLEHADKKWVVFSGL